jgi:hypothetical protein
MADEDDFWNYSFELALIRKFAHASGGSAWSYLGSCLARTSAAIPYNVMLPDIIGDRVSTALYVALVGDSGQGKNSSASGANLLMPCDIHVAKFGSGEGITHQYAWREKGGDELQWYKRSILFESGEAETLKALFSRNNSTLAGEIRSAWMGESIGFGYSDVRKRLILPASSYRLSVLATFTPSMGGVLLDGIAEGTPQRFLFLPVHDPNKPKTRSVMKPEDQLIISIPEVDDDELVVVKVPQQIRYDLMDAHDEKVVREFGQMTDEELLDTHFNLLRLKIAFTLGMMLNSHRKRYVVTSDDWDLSGFIMDKHRETRTKLIVAAEAELHKKDKKEGRSLGVRYAASDEIRRDGLVSDRIMQILMKAKKGKGNEWISGSKLRNLMSPKQRESFDDVIASLESGGKVESAPTVITANNRVLGRRYRARLRATYPATYPWQATYPLRPTPPTRIYLGRWHGNERVGG